MKVLNGMSEFFLSEFKAFNYDDISRSLRLEEFNEAIKYARDLKLNLVEY